MKDEEARLNTSLKRGERTTWTCESISIESDTIREELHKRIALRVQGLMDTHVTNVAGPKTWALGVLALNDFYRKSGSLCMEYSIAANFGLVLDLCLSSSWTKARFKKSDSRMKFFLPDPWDCHRECGRKTSKPADMISNVRENWWSRYTVTR